MTRAERLTRFDFTVDSGESKVQRHAFEPSMTGEDRRLRYYLYVDSAPENVGPETAQDDLHVCVDVEAAQNRLHGSELEQ